MKKLVVLFLALVFVSSTAFAAWQPTLLKLSAPPEVAYDFDGSVVEIPVSVTGTDAQLYFLVYTKGIGATVPNIQNGMLGWHQVCGIDTCVYLAPAQQVTVGATTVSWDGMSDARNGGGMVAGGEYTYYLFAFDNVGAKNKCCHYQRFDSMGGTYFEPDNEDGTIRSNPIVRHSAVGDYNPDGITYPVEEEGTVSDGNPGRKWVLGSEPMDETQMIKCGIPLPEGYRAPDSSQNTYDHQDHGSWYQHIANSETEAQTVGKYTWVDNGTGVLDTDWGESGYCDLRNDPVRNEVGCTTDGTWIFTGLGNRVMGTEPGAWFYIIDEETGELEEEIDIRHWWTRPWEVDWERTPNSGPSQGKQRGDTIALNCCCTCFKQCVNPVRYMESGDIEQLYVWSNQNGDYVMDGNFEETADYPWACNYPAGGYNYTSDLDANLFDLISAYDHGAVSFGLFGPDGFGIGYCSYANETAGWKKGTILLDWDTPFDGIYTDNEQAGGTHYQEGGYQRNEYCYGLFFIGHDSISGTISNAVGVAEAPEAVDVISLAQNAPNPFNPTTTINFSLAKAGDTTVEIYNVAGQKIDTVVNEYREAGTHSVVWDASQFSAGIYFCTAKSSNHSKTIKMTLIK